MQCVDSCSIMKDAESLNHDHVFQGLKSVKSEAHLRFTEALRRSSAMIQKTNTKDQESIHPEKSLSNRKNNVTSLNISRVGKSCLRLRSNNISVNLVDKTVKDPTLRLLSSYSVKSSVDKKSLRVLEDICKFNEKQKNVRAVSDVTVAGDIAGQWFSPDILVTNKSALVPRFENVGNERKTHKSVEESKTSIINEKNQDIALPIKERIFRYEPMYISGSALALKPAAERRVLNIGDGAALEDLFDNSDVTDKGSAPKKLKPDEYSFSGKFNLPSKSLIGSFCYGKRYNIQRLQARHEKKLLRREMVDRRRKRVKKEDYKIETLYQCFLCPYSHENRHHVAKHWIESHITEKPYHCGDCGLGFATSWRAETHIKLHHSITGDSIEVSFDKSSRFDTELAYKIDSNVSGSVERMAEPIGLRCKQVPGSVTINDRSVICKYCRNKFKNWNYLKKHDCDVNMAICKITYECQYCRCGSGIDGAHKCKFKSVAALRYHVLKVHSDKFEEVVDKYRHEVDEPLFDPKIDWKKKLISISVGDINQWYCVECKSCFTESLTAREHVIVTHWKYSSAECSSCAQPCPFFRDTREELYIRCNLCKTLASISPLLADRITIYTCHVCVYTTTSHKAVVTHLKRFHSRIQPYFCMHCDFCAESRNLVCDHIRRNHPNMPVKIVEKQVTNSAFKLKLESLFNKLIIQQEINNTENSTSTTEGLGIVRRSESELKRNVPSSKQISSKQISSSKQIDSRPAASNLIESTPVSSNIDLTLEEEDSLKDDGNCYRCIKCNYGDKGKSEILQHVYDKHLNHQIFSCPYCYYTNADRLMLRKHLAFKHPGRRVLVNSFSCSKQKQLLQAEQYCVPVRSSGFPVRSNNPLQSRPKEVDKQILAVNNNNRLIISMKNNVQIVSIKNNQQTVTVNNNYEKRPATFLQIKSLTGTPDSNKDGRLEDHDESHDLQENCYIIDDTEPEISEEEISGKNVGEDYVCEENVGEDYICEENVCEENVGEENVDEEKVGEDNVGEDYVCEDNVGEDNVGEDYVCEENVGEDNLDEDNISECNISKENISEENISEDNVSEENMSEDNVNEENVSEISNMRSVENDNTSVRVNTPHTTDRDDISTTQCHTNSSPFCQSNSSPSCQSNSSPSYQSNSSPFCQSNSSPSSILSDDSYLDLLSDVENEDDSFGSSLLHSLMKPESNLRPVCLDGLVVDEDVEYDRRIVDMYPVVVITDVLHLLCSGAVE